MLTQTTLASLKGTVVLTVALVDLVFAAFMGSVKQGDSVFVFSHV